MAFQMIHMEIAYELSNRIDLITNKADFILGCVAPDSVHMNPDYNVRLKVRSHMFEGCGEWSNTQDYERWEQNIIHFWRRYGMNEQNPDNKSFVAGVCVHCYTDYYNDINIWRRLQKIHLSNMTLEQFRSDYYPEARGIDQWLYHNSGHTQEIRNLLSKGKGIELDGMLNINEIESQKYHLLYEQYASEQEDISKYRFLSEADIKKFISETVCEIEKKFNQMFI